MSKSKNEICEKLYSLFQENKQAGKIAVKDILEAFRDELYHGARLALNAETDNAAITTVSVSCVQSQVLALRGKFTQTNRLQFAPENEAAKKTLAGMIASEILWIEFSPDENHGLVCMKVTDGIEEAVLVAKNPLAGLKVDDIAWVQEPFTLTGERAGKTWAEMTSEERIEAGKTGLRNPSQMPKYMMARRAQVEAININNDGRNAWIEVTYKEIERFEKSEADMKAIREELGISEESAKNEETENGQEAETGSNIGVMSVDQEEEGVDLTGVDIERLHSDVQNLLEEEAAGAISAEAELDVLP